MTAGGPSFTLTVTGSNYTVTSVVRIGGANRPTVYVSALQLNATVFASDIVTPTALTVTVFNALPTGGGLTSNGVTLTVSNAPAPSLVSAAPGFMGQGADHVRMTLVGANFRPGATVVISPPLASLNNSTGNTRASDVNVLSVTVVNAGLMTALVSVSPTAKVGLRAVDVLNLDGTSTAGKLAAAGSGTSQALELEAGNSLGAPLAVANMGVTSPRDGTVVMQGDELNGEAVLGGTGTGTVIGQWVWDGNVVEQFSAALVGGQSTTVRTRQSLPTWFLGAHTLQLRMVQPNQIASRPVVVVVNPGGWKREQLIQPPYGAAFASDNPPRLLWAPVPGAAKYQVGFSEQPYLGTIRTWYDADDNRWEIPAKIWRGLPEGELYWTVRAVEASGEARRPLPMRSVVHIAEGALTPARAVPARTLAGNTLLEWKPAQKGGFYFVTVSRDYEGNHVVRQYLTADAKVDLRAADRGLNPGTTYYWRVDAIAPNGKLILFGPVQSFVAEASPKASWQENSGVVQLASLGAPASLPALPPDLAAQIAARTPLPDSSISQLQPAISVSFLAAVNPSDVSMMVDDVDITTLAQVTEMKVTFTPPLALTGGDHNVNLGVGSEATTWKFTVMAPAATAAAPAPPAPSAAAGPALQPGTDAEAPPAAAPSGLPAPGAIAAAHQAAAKAAAQPTGPSLEGQVSANTQWASGSNPPDTNVVAVAERMMYEQGPWHVEVNGSGLLDSTLNPEALRTSQGRVNDYVIQLAYHQGDWGAKLRFGIVSPALYTDAQFVTAATPRQGAEVMLQTPAGQFGYFANTNDEALGGGAGINFHQQLMGASWQAPLPKWAQFRVMWLSAQDTGAPTTVGYDSQGNPIILPNPVAPKSSGDVYGALLNIHFAPKWLWSSEYAFSRENPDTTDATSTWENGRAWRTGISGQTGNTNVNVAYRDVGPNFGNPANPSLTQASQPDLRGVDSSLAQTTKGGTFGLNYSFLQNNAHPTTSDELYLDSIEESWSKTVGKTSNLVVDARESLTQTGTVPASLQGQPPAQTGAQDMRDLSGSVNLSRQVGMVTLSGGGTRDWNTNHLFPLASAITSSLNFGTNLVTKGIFQLNSQANVNWVAADGATVGTARNITVYAQPSLVWKRPALQVAPLITLTKGRTILANGTLTSDTLTGQYGGRITWTLPGTLKFSTLSAQGNYNQNRNTILSLDQRTTELLVVWTITWNQKHVF